MTCALPASTRVPSPYLVSPLALRLPVKVVVPPTYSRPSPEVAEPPAKADVGSNTTDALMVGVP